MKRPDISSRCAESCAIANSCSQFGIDPFEAIAIAKVTADKPYAACHSQEGPTIHSPNRETCHLDPTLKVALGGLAAGMELALEGELTIPLPLNGQLQRDTQTIICTPLQQEAVA